MQCSWQGEQGEGDSFLQAAMSLGQVHLSFAGRLIKMDLIVTSRVSKPAWPLAWLGVHGH